MPPLGGGAKLIVLIFGAGAEVPNKKGEGVAYGFGCSWLSWTLVPSVGFDPNEKRGLQSEDSLTPAKGLDDSGTDDETGVFVAGDMDGGRVDRRTIRRCSSCSAEACSNTAGTLSVSSRSICASKSSLLICACSFRRFPIVSIGSPPFRDISYGSLRRRQ